MTNEVRSTNQRGADEGNPRSKDTQQRVFVAGTPYVHPSFALNPDGVVDQLNWWDRIVLLGGGCLLGLSIGASATTLVIGSYGDTRSVALYLCSLIVLNLVVNLSLYLRTKWMINSFSGDLNTEKSKWS